MQLILTNSGTEPCLLKGFAGVSLTAGADGEPIGAAATRDDSAPVTDVLLAPGKAGTATLRYTQAANYPDCTRTPAAGFRVYPPNDTASLFIAQPLDACSQHGHQPADHRSLPAQVTPGHRVSASRARAPSVPGTWPPRPARRAAAP